MKNNLGDLNNYLFEQLERLNDNDLSCEELDTEIKRSTAVTKVAGAIIANASIVLRAQQVFENDLKGVADMPKMLEGQENGKAKTTD